MGKVRREDLFGSLVVKHGLCDQATLDQYAAEVARRKSLGEKVNLGKVLVECGIISMLQAKKILQIIQRDYPKKGGSTQSDNAPPSPGHSDVHDTAKYEETMMSPTLDYQASGSAAAAPAGEAAPPPPPPPPPPPKPASAPPSPGRAPSGAQQDPLIGRVLGKYTIKKLLGRGSMGAVYYAENEMLGRATAIKVLPVEASDSNPEFVARFQREARVAAQVEHPNLVAVFDVGQEGEWHYLAMQFVEGRTWGDLIKDHLKRGTTLPIKESIRFARDSLEGLAAAHAEGITHRDIKPDNIMIAKDGTVKITDFGLARAEGGEVLTVAGRALGTPRFMSPEQWRGGNPDYRWDLYSLGMTLYHSVCGDFPYQTGRSQIDLIRNLMQNDPIPLIEKNPDVGPDINAVVMKLIDKDIQGRYQAATEAVADLSRILEALERGETPQGTVSVPQPAAARTPHPGTPPSRQPTVPRGGRLSRSPAPPAKGNSSVVILSVLLVIAILAVIVLAFLILTGNNAGNAGGGDNTGLLWDLAQQFV